MLHHCQSRTLCSQDHKAVVAYAGQVNVLPLNKRRHRRLFRRRSPAQHARFLEYTSALNTELDNDDMQLNFDTVYVRCYAQPTGAVLPAARNNR